MLYNNTLSANTFINMLSTLFRYLSEYVSIHPLRSMIVAGFIIIIWCYFKLKKAIESNRKTEQVFPEIDRLKVVNTVTAPDDRTESRMGALNFFFWLIIFGAIIVCLLYKMGKLDEVISIFF